MSQAPRKRRRQRGDRGRLLAEMEGLCARLGEIGRELFLMKPHARDVRRSLPDLELELPISFEGRGERAAAAARSVLSQLDAHLDDAILQLAAFRPGSVWSFFDERADLPVCRPKEPREIFVGYTETGVPRWQTMLGWAVEKGLEDADLLAEEGGLPIAALLGREELVGRRLESFSRQDRLYDLLGQLAVGYYESATEEGRGRFAVSIQVVRSTTRGGAVRLGANAIGLLPDGRPVESLLETDVRHPCLELLRRAERRLAAVNQDLKRQAQARRREASEREAERLLASLAQEVTQFRRRRSWRTGHASDRAREGGRPTGMVRDDLAAARPERVFRDAQDRTVVVLAPRGRVHVFSDEGLHVTSLHLDRKSLDQRLQRRRWQPMLADEVAQALDRVRRRFENAG